MRSFGIILVVGVLLSVQLSVRLTAQQDNAADILRDADLNDGDETYALAFRSMPRGMEAWLTVAGTGQNGARKLARSTCTPKGFTPPVVVDDPALNALNTMYNGVPSFNPCNANEAIVVSDRPAQGTSRRSNDLYFIRYEGGRWNAERMNVNSDAWDDTPAFSNTGQTMYFSSDRRHPGSGAGDLFMSRRNGNTWSEPVLLSGVCTDRHHESSPFVDGEGTLYYSTNTHGDQDIWTVQLDSETGLPTGEPKKIEIPGVNKEGSDEYHPTVSPGGGWFMFSSDRTTFGQRGEFRLYHKRMPPKTFALNLRVTARTKIADETKLRYFGKLDSIYNVRTSIEWRELPDASSSGLNTNNKGEAVIALSSTDTQSPSGDNYTRTFILSAVPHQRGYVGGVDTLLIDIRNCKADLEHVLYLDDTTTKSRSCEFTFRTFNVPFFVTTYWCPTTNKYRKYTPCTSLFTDEIVCENLDQPKHCETNEAYKYTFTPAKLERATRNAENCVNYSEFTSHGANWADEVDANIERMRDEVSAALNEPCIQEAIARGYTVSVTYVGTTDDRGIHQKCQYTGADLDAIRSVAPAIEIDTNIAPFIKTGQRFNGGGYGGRAGGNQLLSDLRSLYFAILFDNLCKETISTYRELRSTGKLKVTSRGQAIDQRDLPYEFKRAAGVEIRIPNFEAIAKGFDAVPHRTIRLCEPVATCR